jgi:hypothetical protein
MQLCLRIMAALGAAVTLSCSDLGDPAPPPTGPVVVPTEVKFGRDVQAIFNSRCAISGCHVAPTPTAGLVLSAGVSYGNLVNVPTQVFTPGVRVTPGDLSNSVMWLLLQSGMMPATGGRITATQLEIIRIWIEDGTPNN